MPDVELLVFEVIELENQRIRFAAIHARMVTKKLEQATGSCLGSLLLSTSFGLDVVPAIRQVVLAAIGRSARSTHVVPLLLSPSAPGELVDWF